MTMQTTATYALPHGLADLARQLSASFIDDVLGVGAVVVATIDGFAIASAFDTPNDAHRIAAMASSISAIGSVVALEANLGAYRSVTINTDSGFVVVHAVQRPDLELVVNVIADGDAILAQVLHRLKSMVAQLLA
jgi:uncharacterized protein